MLLSLSNRVVVHTKILVGRRFFSHMSNADAADQSHAHGQAQKFHKMVDEIRAFRPDADYRFSLANSAGLLSVKDSLFTDARPGIIQYGIMHPLMCQID